MTVGAVNPEALDRIIRVCRHADLMASVVARWTLVRGDDGKFHEIAYRETLRYRADKTVDKLRRHLRSSRLLWLLTPMPIPGTAKYLVWANKRGRWA